MNRRTWISAVLVAAFAGGTAACGGGGGTVEAQAKPEPLSIEAAKIEQPLLRVPARRRVRRKT